MVQFSLLGVDDIKSEVDRAIDLLVGTIGGDKACVLVSGGLDSDVAARLTAMAVGPERLKLVTILQDDMSQTHRGHAQRLAKDLGSNLVEVDLRGVHLDIVYRLASADPGEEFDPLALLDPARMKCSLRTTILSTYQDRGHVIIGTSNHTEYDLGFYLPFGDGLWHVGPIAHLYKTEVRLVAEFVGTARKVLDQPPSAGFWRGQTDREDLGYWLVNGGPIHRQRSFSAEETRRATALSARLEERDVDLVLLAISAGVDPFETDVGVRLGAEVVEALAAIVLSSARSKNMPLGTMLQRIAREPVT
jgi:NAD+ synthase